MVKSVLRITALILLFSGIATAQEFEKKLGPFSKITVSPKIHLVLTQGDEESIRITYSGIDAGQVNVAIENNKLRLYLDEARIVDKRAYYDDHNGRRSIYHHAQVTAYVTFRDLRLLEVRGDQDVTVNQVLGADQFLVRAYGSAHITIDTLQARSLKVVAYGENRIKIKAGKAGNQRYVLYGENKIDSRNLDGHTISSSIYGEGRLTVNASDEVRINAIGEPEINVSGTSFINKGLVIGRPAIHKENP
ncbi:MAG: DUF2807 domain-containing protein [Cyclobacteriaceae bacterium]|nr:DUF2807 domain-containing protein [Cyclobacteriaceae bacterium]